MKRKTKTWWMCTTCFRSWKGTPESGCPYSSEHEAKNRRRAGRKASRKIKRGRKPTRRQEVRAVAAMLTNVCLVGLIERFTTGDTGKALDRATRYVQDLEKMLPHGSQRAKAATVPDLCLRLSTKAMLESPALGDYLKQQPGTPDYTNRDLINGISETFFKDAQKK